MGCTMKRWMVCLLGMGLTLGLTSGCQQKCFIAEKDYFYSHNMLPCSLEDGDLSAGIQPKHDPSMPPPTVTNPDRPPRHLSLQEAIALGLENGISGSKNGGANTPGVADDSPAVVTGGSLNSQSDYVRVLALQPAISGSNIEAAIAKFDAVSVTSITWTGTDELFQGLSNFSNGEQGVFNTSIIKGLAAGGIVNTTLQTQYTLLTSPPAGSQGVINPNYTTRLTFGFEQPLLRNFGVDVNQLLPRLITPTGATLPTQAATAYNNQQGLLGASAGQPLEGILITRLRFDQQRAEFERQMHNLLLNVEVAYWNLYEAYGALYANEEVLRVLHKLWQDTYYKAQSGIEKAPPDVLAQVKGQYEEFRGERTNSLAAVLEAERNLRRIIGLKLEDGTRIVPVTPPTLAQYQPSWEAALSDAMVHRPELVLARENLRFHQLALTREKTFLQPDLRFVAQYQPVGFGTNLISNSGASFIDGQGNPQINGSLNSVSGMHYNDYTVGLTLSVPLGYRFEHASIRSARLQLAQAFYVLKDQEERVRSTLDQEYAGLAKWYALIETRREERKAYADSLAKKFKSIDVGRKTIDLDLLDVQRRLALALNKEYQAIAEYNSTLARLEFARGTIMQHDNVVIAENGLTPCAQIRAVDNEAKRTNAFILRERPSPLNQPGMLTWGLNDGAVPRATTDLAPPPLPDDPAKKYPKILDTEPGNLPMPTPAVNPEAGNLEKTAQPVFHESSIPRPLPAVAPEDNSKPAVEAPPLPGQGPPIPREEAPAAGLPAASPLPDFINEASRLPPALEPAAK